MKEILTSFKDLASNNRKLLVAMIFLFVASVVFVVIAIINIQPSNIQIPVRQTGHLGDGFYFAHWYYLYTFPFLGIVFGVLHNILAAKIYGKKGAQIAAIFVAVTFVLLLVTVITMARIFSLPGVG